MPDSWFKDSRPEANRASERLANAESRYNKLKKINEYQDAQQSELPKAQATQKQIPANRNRKPTSSYSLPVSALGASSSIAALSSAYTPSSSKSKEKEKERDVLSMFESEPFRASFEDSRVGQFTDKVNEFKEGLAGDLSFDGFLNGLANVTGNVVITGALGAHASIAHAVVSQLSEFKDVVEKINTGSDIHPLADALSSRDLGFTLEESVNLVKLVFSASEKLDAMKQRVIKSHKEKFEQFATLVIEGYKSAQENYPWLIKKESQSNSEELLIFLNLMAKRLQQRSKELEHHHMAQECMNGSV